MSRLLPGGLAEKLRRDGRQIGETERVVVTVLMSDIRSYSTIAEHADPSQLAGQLNIHRAAMNDAILGENGTVMQFVGDAVMAVFGAPFEQVDHADRAVVAALAMHRKQATINRRWADGGPAALRAGPGPFDRRGCRGPARIGGTAGIHPRRGHGEHVPTAAAAGGRRRDRGLPGHRRRLGSGPVETVALPPQLVKGRETPVIAYKLVDDGRPAGDVLAKEGG